jgi:hypothetical protein
MRPAPDVLPRSLREIASIQGLDYFVARHPSLTPYPVAGRRQAALVDTVEDINRMPIQPNFVRVVLDMDNVEDQQEYVRIMSYYRAGYGMDIIYLDRQFIKKIRIVAGRKKHTMVQRIFLEYYAPYRIASHDRESVSHS